jgi:hypothetical protein
VRVLSVEFYWGIREICKRRLWKRATVPTEVPVGEPGEGSFTRTFEIKMEGSVNGSSLVKFTWAPFLDPDYVRSLSVGAIWNFCIKDQSFHELASEYGAQRACLKA